jgi:hypothetical protein
MKMVSEKRAIDKIFRRRDRYDIPDWQRGEVWNREKKQPRRLVIPAAVFVFSTLAFSAFVHPAALGIVLCSFCFCFLFFIGRGMNEFNPHWELAASNCPLDKEKFGALTKLFSQYTFTAIAAIAVIVAACFFNASTLIKDALWTQSDLKLYRVVQIPFLMTTVAYGTWGCFWVSVLIIRELHVKQHEVLLMPITSSNSKDSGMSRVAGGPA